MPEPDKQDEYYAEDHFEGGVKPGGRIYTGPLLLVGASAILGSFLMSSATRVRWHVHYVHARLIGLLL